MGLGTLGRLHQDRPMQPSFACRRLAATVATHKACMQAHMQQVRPSRGYTPSWHARHCTIAHHINAATRKHASQQAGSRTHQS